MTKTVIITTSTLSEFDRLALKAVLENEYIQSGQKDGALNFVIANGPSLSIRQLPPFTPSINVLDIMDQYHQQKWVLKEHFRVKGVALPENVDIAYMRKLAFYDAVVEAKSNPQQLEGLAKEIVGEALVRPQAGALYLNLGKSLNLTVAGYEQPDLFLGGKARLGIDRGAVMQHRDREGFATPALYASIAKALASTLDTLANFLEQGLKPVRADLSR